MTEIVLCNTPLKPDLLKGQCGINPDEIRGQGHKTPLILNSYTPYLVGQNQSTVDRNILSCLSQLQYLAS